MKKWIIISIAILVVGGTAFYYFNRKKNVPLTFETSKAHYGYIAESIMATGTIQPVDTVAVGSQVSGVIQNIYVDFNSVVKKGQLIATIDSLYANSIKTTLTSFQKSAADINLFTAKLNNEKGIVSKLLTDQKMATSLDSTLLNLQTGTIKLNEIEEAAKHNFLLRGYFKKQEKANAKKKKALQKTIK